MIRFLIITALIFSVVVSKAQSSQPVEGNNKTPRITKGYYAIGDHAKKLPPKNVLRFVRTEGDKDQPRKGYYAIESKPQTKMAYQLPAGQDKPKKGYYSIGGNN